MSDATGNRWRPGTKPTRAGELFLRDILWPGDDAWKFRVEFVPTGKCRSEETLTLPPIALPLDDQAVHFNTPFEVNGCVVTIIDIAGRGTRLPFGDGISVVAQDGNVHLKVRCPAARMGKRFSFVRLTDEQGREIPY